MRTASASARGRWTGRRGGGCHLEATGRRALPASTIRLSEVAVPGLLRPLLRGACLVRSGIRRCWGLRLHSPRVARALRPTRLISPRSRLRRRRRLPRPSLARVLRTSSLVRSGVGCRRGFWSWRHTLLRDGSTSRRLPTSEAQASWGRRGPPEASIILVDSGRRWPRSRALLGSAHNGGSAALREGNRLFPPRPQAP
jgi:hypothetical protein